MKKGWFAILAAGLLAGGAHAGLIDLQNPADGSDKLDVETYADINLVWIGGAADSIQVSFINAFLDTDNDIGVVTNYTGGQGGWTYDRSAFDLPAELDEAGGKEYGLVSGDSDGSAKLPLGFATHIIDVLQIHNDDNVNGSSTLVTFELGARQPQVFGPPPTYSPYTVAVPGFPHGFPNQIYLGDNNSNNDGFEINWIPEPASLGLLVLGGLVSIRRRR